MTNTILNKLHEIEQAEDVRVLLAVESGSRAWGFASTDSDYDVRFIYVRQQEYYLRLEKRRDVLEYPINDLLDINGWDLDKALRLLNASNPGLFEWFSSPIVYLESEFSMELKSVLNRYFSPKKALYHYQSMAFNNYREFLTGEMVKVKKYFYVLRPVLACRWILEKQTPPPVLFSELADAELEDALKPEVERLLDIKANQPELKLVPRVEVLNEYLEAKTNEIKEAINGMPEDAPHGWTELDGIFLRETAKK